MWILRSHKTGTTYHLLVGQTYSVGRKNTNILIENDPSLSRHHAVLTVTHLEANLSDPSRLPTLKIHDVGSKYGTSRNDVRLGKEEETLEDGDSIKFGQFDSVFSVCYVPFVITTSCIEAKSAAKAELKKFIHQLGGHLVSEWKPDCTHLVMPDIKITIKAVCCLISQKPIVSPNFVSDMVTNFSSGLPEPIPNKYIPPIGEAIIDKEKVDFGIVPERKKVFENKTFIFLDKKMYKKMRLVAMIGGGSAIYHSLDSPADPSQILKEGTCVVQPQLQNASISIHQQEIFNLLQRNNKRMIQESDFGLAVAYCSTEMFCNPDYDMGNSQSGFARLYSQTLTQHEVCMHDMPRNESSSKKPDSSLPAEQVTTIKKSASSVQDTPGCSNTSRNKRKTRDSHDHKDALQPCFKQTKLESFVNISAAKPSDQEKAADSINVEGIALCSSSVKEEPLSADEMEVDNSSVIACTPVTVEGPVPSVVELNSSMETSLNHSTRNSSKKPKPVQNPKVSSSNQNGFVNSKKEVPSYVDTNNDEENDLPRNLIQIEYADLVCVKPSRTNVLKNRNLPSNGKNFKKFRKVLPLVARLLPQIIGGHDLEAYSRQASKALDEILNDSCDVLPSHNFDDDEAGEFEWDPSKARKKRKI